MFNFLVQQRKIAKFLIMILDDKSLLLQLFVYKLIYVNKKCVSLM